MQRPLISPWFLILGLAACGGAPPPLTAQRAIGPADGTPGHILVFSSHCANMEVHCPSTWSQTVDAIVTSGLSFHGYATIDPAKLRKDEATRSETTATVDSTTSVTTDRQTGDVGVV